MRHGVDMNEEYKEIDWDKLLDILQQDEAEGKNLSPAETELLAELKSIKAESYDLLSNYKSYHKQERWLELKAHITQSDRQAADEIETPLKLWPRVVAAAVAIIIIGAGLFYYNVKQKDQPEQAVVHHVDIEPGKQGATLTLASGQKIRLSDAVNGELAKEAGVSITKSEDGQLVYEIQNSESDGNKINTLSTSNGETYKLRLPDGSLVWLNAASSLTYTASLIERGKRTVRLNGEGYFQVAKDKAHPFIVESNGQQIEVLGTHFNVSAYGDDPQTKTTLEEGSIKIASGAERRILKPNQQAILSEKGIQVKEIDAELALAWKSGFFLFDRESLESIMIKVARWYDVEVMYTDPALKAKTFTGTISRFEKISQVFSMLEQNEVANFKIEGRKITISKMN